MASIAEDTNEIKDRVLSRKRDEILDYNLGHISKEDRKYLDDRLKYADELAWSLHDLRPSMAPVENSFEVTDEKPIVHRA